jgi:hypothetical protein
MSTARLNWSTHVAKFLVIDITVRSFFARDMDLFQKVIRERQLKFDN